MQVLSVNPFLALLFRWSHEHIVFTAADKGYLLYGGFISTFLVQAFLFDADTNADRSFATAIENVLIGALFANVVLFPIQYVLPVLCVWCWCALAPTVRHRGS